MLVASKGFEPLSLIKTKISCVSNDLTCFFAIFVILREIIIFNAWASLFPTSQEIIKFNFIT